MAPTADQGSSRRLRLLHAGLGGFGRSWATEVVPQVPEVVAVGWIDPSPQSLALTERAAGEARVPTFSNLEAALAATAADALLVTADLPHHSELVRRGLEAGLHVLVEKPFAPSVGEAEELVALAEQRQRVVMVSQNYRFHPVVREVADLLGSGRLGPVDEVEIDFRRLSEPRGGVLARHHREEQPLLVDMSIHHFDLLRLLLASEPARIDCRTWLPAWCAFSGPPAGTAIVEFGNGAVVSYRGSWVSRGTPTTWTGDWRIQCGRGEIRWSGRGDTMAGGAYVEVRHARDDDGIGSVERFELRPLRFEDRAGSLHEFGDAVLSGREPETSGRRNLGTLALVEAAVSSASAEQPVLLREGEPAQAGAGPHVP